MDGHRARGGGGDQLVLAQPAILGVGPLLEIADWDVMMLARFGQSNSPTGNSNITRVPPGGKANIAPPAKATWFKIVAVPCANGEHTPTVESWTYPNAFDAVTPEHVHRVRTMAAEGRYRKDSRAEDWIGRAVAEVLDLDLEDEADRKQIKNILKTWFANGVLDTKIQKDDIRHERAYVVPGNWADEGCVS